MVRFENVGLRYSLGPEVLRDVSFQLAPRSFQFLTGPSGAGATSSITALSGVANQLFLQLAQRTLRPASPRAPALI